MQRFLKPILIFTLVFIGFLAFSYKAEASGNVNGYAWSDSAGWISMNCNNSALQAGFNINTCSTADYGVSLNMTTGAMTGYGWSDNIGWIKFDSVPPPAPPYPSNPSSPAKISSPSTPGIRPSAGWARFCSNVNQTILPDNCSSNTNGTTPQNGGWNGWISMKGTSQSGVAYGVTFDGTTGNFGGFAWGGTVNAAGSEVVGWISFTGVKIINTTYVPVIALGGVSPIGQNANTDISYRWQNADSDPLHQFDSCQAFTSHGLVIQGNSVDPASGSLDNWDSRTTFPYTPTFPRTIAFPISSQYPSSTLQWSNIVYAYAPSTTYYLACMTVGGQMAADPSNPTTECNLATPATVQATCPRTTVTTSVASFPLEIKDSTINGPWTQLPLVDVAGTVSLRWTFPAGAGNCRGYAVQNGVANWPRQFNGGQNKTQAGSPETNVVVVSPQTDYFMTCVVNGITATSNTVTAIPKALPGGLNLVGRPDGSNGGYSTSFTVSPGEKVQLRGSSQLVNYFNCRAITTTSTQPAGWTTGLVKPDIAPPLYGWTEPIPISVPNDPTKYRLRCQLGTNGAWVESGDVTVDIVQPTTPTLALMIKLDNPSAQIPNSAFGNLTSPTTSVIVSQAENVALHWEANVPISLNTCRATSSSPGSSAGQYWSGPKTIPAALPGAMDVGVNLERTANTQTTYTITCAPADGSADISATATAIPLAPSSPGIFIDDEPNCVKTDTSLFDLGWTANNLSGGTCSLSSSGGNITYNDTRPNAPRWDGTTTLLTNSVHILVEKMQIDAATTFTLTCTSASGTTYPPINHPITIYPTCTDAPRSNWFFRFFER